MQQELMNEIIAEEKDKNDEIVWKYFSLSKKKWGMKILNNKQILQRLPIALAQVNAGNTSENLLNEIRQILYSLYRAK